MDELISKGDYFIYEEENGMDTLIYDPAKGFLKEKPIFGPDKPKEEYSPELINAVRAFLMEKEGNDG